MASLLRLLRNVAFFTGMFLVAIALVVSTGVGVGYCLSWLVPEISFGHGTIVGLLAELIVLFVVLKALTTLLSTPIGQQGALESPDDTQLDYLAESIADRFVSTLGMAQVFHEYDRQPSRKRRAQRKTV